MHVTSGYHPGRGEANSRHAGWGQRKVAGEESSDLEVPPPRRLPRALLPGPLSHPISVLHDLQGMMYKTQIIPSLNNL